MRRFSEHLTQGKLSKNLNMVVTWHYMLKPRISALMKGEMGNEVKENPKISLESP